MGCARWHQALRLEVLCAARLCRYVQGGAAEGCGYRIPNGPRTIGGTRHDHKKPRPSLALRKIHRA
jgi:hypothetical protein